MHGVPQPAWFDQSQDAGADRFESMSQMPRAGADAAGRSLYWQFAEARRAACGVSAAGRMLEREMSYGGAWLECASEDAVLRGDA